MIRLFRKLLATPLIGLGIAMALIAVGFAWGARGPSDLGDRIYPPEPLPEWVTLLGEELEEEWERP